jgi:hypothetical protein
MVPEYKLFFNHLDQKAALLKAMPLLFIVYFMTKQPAPNPMLISGLTGIAVSFSVLEFSGNVFGLDYGAFYLHYTGARPAWVSLLRRVAMAVSIQAVLATLISVAFFFRTDAASFRLHVLLMGILVLQNFCTGCLFSAFFPAAIPRDIKNKVFRTNPGTGFSLNAALNFMAITAFYSLAKLLPEAMAHRCYAMYIALLAIAVPVAVVVAARQLAKNKYGKWCTLTQPD